MPTKKSQSTQKALSGTKAKRAPTFELNPDELAAVLAGARFGIYQSGGTVTQRVEGGVYCQFNRPGHDGSVHVNVVVPETFVLDTFPYHLDTSEE